MKTKYIIFTDIDGTLYKTKDEYHPKIKYAIDEIKEHEDLELAICTGNGMFDQVKSVAEKMGARYIIASNGSTIYDTAKEKFLNVVFMNPNAIEKITEYFEETNKMFHSWDIHTVFTNEDTDDRVSKIHKFLGESVDIKKPTEIAGQLLSITKYGTPESIDEVEEFVGALDAKTVRPREDFIEIIPSKSNKGFAVQWLANYLDVDLKNTASIGDSMNDVPMFRVTGQSYVVANAEEKVWQFATKKAPAVEENGAGLAILDLINNWYNYSDK